MLLALFVALAAYPSLYTLATIVSVMAAILLAMLAGLLLGTALPALPFITLSFLTANAPTLYKAFSRGRKHS